MLHRAPPTFADLAPFLEPAHRALSEEIARALHAEEPALHDPPRVAAALAKRGLFELVVPQPCGGRLVSERSRASVDVRALCLAREALAYVSPLADSVFAVQGLGSHAFVLAEHDPRRAGFLREVAKGARIGAFALTEPEAGSDVASMRTTARRSAGGWTIDGEKVFISNAGIAHHYLVFAKVPTDGEEPKKTISCFLVPADAPGLMVEPVPMSLDHPLGRLTFRGCEVPGDALVGEVGKGLRLALGTLDVFRTSVGAAACGMARRALDQTIDRVKARVQFGKPLAEQPLVQAEIADMATLLDAARLLVYRAAFMKDRGEKASAEVAMAKMFATEAAQKIIDRAVQLHGGLGVTTSVVEQLYREIRPLRIYEGTTEIQKLIIGGARLA